MDGNIVGTTLGVAAGVYKGIAGAITTSFTAKALLFISWDAIIETAILALIGGAIGWIGAEIMRGFKRLYLKWRYKPK